MDDGFSYSTIEAEFIDQETCIHVSNKSPKPIYFMKDQPIAIFDLRPCCALLGYPFCNMAAHTEATPTREGI